MKRLTFLATALASLFFAASCQQEENLEPVAQGTAVKFQVEVPGGMDTKAIADASEINVVHYEIYKVEHDEADDKDYTYSTGVALAKGHVPVSKKTADVTFDLLVDQEYVAIFWAQETTEPTTGENDYYVIDDLREISLTDPAKTTGNAESRAAFFRTYMFSTATVQDHTVTLYRPFAQLNLGTTMESLTPEQEGEESGYRIVLDKSQVLVTGLATKFNTIAGIENLTVENNDAVHCGEAVSGSTTTYAFDFESAAVPTNPDVLKVTDKNGIITTDYKYVAMNYFFATNNVTVEYNIVTDKGTVNNTITNVPVAENFRTNIIGNLLTSKTDFEIIVDPDFNDSVTGEPNPDENLYMVFDEHQLQDAVNKAINPGTYTFYLGADMGGDVMITQREGVNIVIDGSKKPATKAEGAKFKYDGTITINGDARANGTETLTISNIRFETSHDIDTKESEWTFITAPSKIEGRYNYSHNITIKDCTFENLVDGNLRVGSANLTGTYNFKMEGCTATNMHSLLQLQSVDNKAVVTDVNAVDCKSGISLGNIASAEITNANITAKGYGVRLDGTDTREVAVTITDSEISAYIPVNVRKMNNAACKATVNVKGTARFNGATYEVAFCSNEYEEGVAPVPPAYKENCKLTGENYNTENFWVYPTHGESAVNLQAAIDDDAIEEITLTEGVTASEVAFNVTNDKVFYFNNFELNAGSSATSMNYALENYGDINVSIYDANFTRAGIFAGEGADVVFNSGIIKHKPERTSRYIFCAQSGSTITIKDGTFTNDRAKNSFFWADNATIYVKGGNFGGSASNKKVVESGTGKVIITGGTFNFDPAAWVANGYVANKVGSNWEVVPAETVKIGEVEYTSAKDAETLTAALNAKAENIVLFPGTYEGTFTPTVPTNFRSLNEDKAVIAGRVNVKVDCTFENIKFAVTDASAVKNTFSGANYKYPAIVTVYAAATSFEGCEFETSYAKAVCAVNYGSHAAGKMLTVNNCSFKGDFYALRSRTLFSVTNSTFDIYTAAGKLAAVFTWGNGNSGADQVTFKGNTNVNENEIYGTQLSSTTFAYDNIVYDVQDNTGFAGLADSVNRACTFTGSTFAEGSETF